MIHGQGGGLFCEKEGMDECGGDSGFAGNLFRGWGLMWWHVRKTAGHCRRVEERQRNSSDTEVQTRASARPIPETVSELCSSHLME